MPHSINEIKGDFTDILVAARHLTKLKFVYKRMHFDELNGKDLTEWSFSKSHLKRFQELVDEAADIRTQRKTWESRARDWDIITPMSYQRPSKPKQAEAQASSTKKR